MVELNGHLKVSGMMDQNTFILTNVGDQYVGEITITDAALYTALVKSFTTYGKSHGISREEVYISPDIKLPVKITITVR
jgi:hypothetical protein